MDSKIDTGHGQWAKRWANGQTGFHEGAPNELLAKYIARVEAPKSPARILVPLSGKAIDLRWLADRGHDVVGVEFVEDAVRAFFDEQKVTPVVSATFGAPTFRAGGVTLVCGDFFEVATEALGQFDVIYDRAALVAIEPPLRRRYVEMCGARLTTEGITFLIGFAYDQSLVAGPPWSVDRELVRELYSQTARSAPHASTIEALETRSAPASPRLQAGGVSKLDETAYLIR